MKLPYIPLFLFSVVYKIHLSFSSGFIDCKSMDPESPLPHLSLHRKVHLIALSEPPMKKENVLFSEGFSFFSSSNAPLCESLFTFDVLLFAFASNKKASKKSEKILSFFDSTDPLNHGDSGIYFCLFFTSST